jgi:O-methyltransferase
MATPLNFLLHNPIFSPIRVAGWSVLNKVLTHYDMAIGPADKDANRAHAYELIHQIRQQTSMVILDTEAYNIYRSVERTGKVPGDLAEVGVFRGGSAHLICEAKGSRTLHLFDTFAGLPKAGEWDPKFQQGGFASSLGEVQAYLQSFAKVHFHPGLFPETASGLEQCMFSFVHLDADLYQSTLSGLEWFYPRMNRGAILISHDYSTAQGVRKAFEDFFAEKPECLLELSGSQVAFVKL